MRKIGIAVLAVGILALFGALNMSTTVWTEPLGSIVSGTWTLPRPIHNIGLMQERQNYILVSSLLIIVGLSLFLFSRFGHDSNNSSQAVKTDPEKQSGQQESSDKKIRHLPFEGAREVSNADYAFFLTRFYNIEKNDVLGKLAADNKLFDSTEEALAYCDQKYKQYVQQEATEREEAEKQGRLATEVIETGRAWGREYKKYGDGSFEFITIFGAPRRFESLDAAKEYFGG
jgi:hypothetical protein